MIYFMETYKFYYFFFTLQKNRKLHISLTPLEAAMMCQLGTSYE